VSQQSKWRCWRTNVRQEVEEGGSINRSDRGIVLGWVQDNDNDVTVISCYWDIQHLLPSALIPALLPTSTLLHPSISFRCLFISSCL